MEYYKRIIDAILADYLEMIGAVLIVGPKWCGKTTTAERHARSVLKLQNPDDRESNLKLASLKPSYLLKGKKPRLIDEWQIAPVLWDAVRTSVDDLSGDGLYILTGSTTVDTSKIMHTGTGRIATLKMKPMSLYESKESNGKIPIIDLFNNPNMDIDGIKSDLSLEELIFATCRGGWPESLHKKSKKSKLFVAKSYLDNIYNNEIGNIAEFNGDSDKIKCLVKSYARNISTLASDETILKDIRTNFIEIGRTSYFSYLKFLKKLFIISNVYSWNPNIRSKTSIRSTSKKEFIDPSIAVAALNLTPDSLLYDLKTFGFIFENLCIRDLSVYTQSVGGHISYYRDKYGLECDCVLHLDDGRYALIEFKLGGNEEDKAAEHLLKLNELISKREGLKKPTFLAIVNGSPYAYRRKDGVNVLPIGTLR